MTFETDSKPRSGGASSSLIRINDGGRALWQGLAVSRVAPLILLSFSRVLQVITAPARRNLADEHKPVVEKETRALVAYLQKNEGGPKAALFCDLHLVNRKTTFPSQLNIGSVTCTVSQERLQ